MLAVEYLPVYICYLRYWGMFHMHVAALKDRWWSCRSCDWMHLLKNIEIIHIQHVHTPNLKPQKQKLAVPPNTDKWPILLWMIRHVCRWAVPAVSTLCIIVLNFYYSYIVLKIPSFNSLIDSCTWDAFLAASSH